MKKRLLSLFSLFFSVALLHAQTTVFFDDFGGTTVGLPTNVNNNTFTTGSTPAGSYTFTNGGNTNNRVSIASGILVLDASSNANVSQGVRFSLSNFSAPFNTTLSSNTGVVTWTFNLRKGAATNGSYGSSSSGRYVATVLCSNNADLSNNTATGYMVAQVADKTYGLFKFSKGVNSATPADYTQIGSTTTATSNATDYCSFKVTYTPSTNSWALFFRNDGTTAFADPAAGTMPQVGTSTVDNTYTGTAMVSYGFFQRKTTSTATAMSFDNFKVTVTVAATNYYNVTGTDISQITNWGTNTDGTGTNPADFTSANQAFNLNNTGAVLSSSLTVSGTGSSLTIGTGATLTINPTASLTIGTGATVDFAGKAVILKSDATGTACIGNTTGTLSGATNVTLERFIPGGKRAFRFLGHPFSNTLNLASLTDDILITGGTGTGGFTASVSNNPSAFWYSPAAGDENATNDIGWTAFTTTDGSGSAGNVWDKYKAIRVLVRGNIADGLSPVTPSAVTIDATGTLNTGTQVIPVTKGTNSGYNFISNPFASNINLTTVGGFVSLGTNLVTNFYVWDMTAGTKGGWVNPAFSSSYILPSFAGFIVKTSAADNITITETAKTATAATGTLYRNNNAKPAMVRLSVTGNNINWDRFELYYNDESILAEDRHDGVKFKNSEVNFYSIANSKDYSIDSRPFVKDGIIPMGFTSAALQSYTIKASEYSLPANVELYLRDKFLSIDTKIEEGTEYSFAVTADPATQGNSRFELVQKQIMALQPLTTKFAVKLSPNPATDMVKVAFSNEEKATTTITITNAEGKAVRTVNAGSTQVGQLDISIKGLAKGSYFVTLNNGTERKTEQLQVQ
jgi:hypothetical protein